MTVKWIRCMLVLSVMSWAAAVAQGQTLADIARQERERRKPSASTRIYTNASLAAPPITVTASVEGVATPAAAAPAATAQAPETKPKGPLDNKGRDEKYWRTTFEQARQDLKRAEDKYRLADLKVNDLSSQLLREGRATVEQGLRSELDRAKADQMAARAEFQQAQQKITDLEEELRRSGGLPGWAR